ncbi:MAG TPA: protein translocase subunit SecD, partial [Stellaceae bacterium]|nr:protein translocase subunit SecD [Stellaceae bacterium]
MLYFANWKIVLISVVCALGVLLSAPNLLSPAFLAQLPDFLPRRQVALGLDLQGGSYLLLRVDVAAAQRERLNSIIDNVRNALLDANIGYTGLAVKDNAIAFTIRDPARIDAARQALTKIDPDLTTTIGSDGAGTVVFSAAATEQKRVQAVDQSIEIIRRRIDETGIKEPTIEREGADRILVQLPGVSDPEHVKALLGRTAKLTFQLVDTGVSLEDARSGKLPLGDEVLPAEDAKNARAGPNAYVVRKRVMVGGDTLVDAQPSFQGNEPVVSFRFDAEGASRFADATRANVGKPFAIVLDNKVISAPIIREAILGGSGIISGSFTVQSASDLALLLRAGALPAPITILEERTVGPSLGADSIHAGALACIVGVALVVVFMILFYGLFGVFADIALFFNLCLMLGSLTLLGAT